MKYYINEKLVEEKDFNDDLEKQVKKYVIANLDDLLGEAGEELLEGLEEYTSSKQLKKANPEAYDSVVDDFVTTFLDDANYEIITYGEYSINNKDFRVEE